MAAHKGGTRHTTNHWARQWRGAMPLILLVVAALLAPGLIAQSSFTPIPDEGVSELYALERERQRREETEAVQVGFDIGTSMAIFNHNFRSSDGGGQDLHWGGDALDEEPMGLMLDARLKVRTSWYDTFTLEYQWFNLSTFNDGVDFNVDFGGSTIPAGSDLDVRSTLHHLVFQYQHDFRMLDRFESKRLFALFGLGYDNVRFSINSDSYPLENDSENMRELWPYPILGLGYEQDLTRDYTFRVYGRGSFIPEVPTLQKRRGEDVDMSIQFYEVAVENEWRPNPWVAIGSYARIQLFQHELSGPRVQQLYKLTAISFGLRLGFRL